MAMKSTSVTGMSLVRDYDDSIDLPLCSPANERAYRQGFLEEARRVLREWVDPDDDTFDPWGEEEAARQLRLRVRERYTVYGAAYGEGCAGRRTYHLGYRPGHAAPAARLRGRHHALAFVVQSWDEVADLDALDYLVLPAWLKAVEEWAAMPIRLDTVPLPPRPLDVAARLGVRLPTARRPSPPPWMTAINRSDRAMPSTQRNAETKGTRE